MAGCNPDNALWRWVLGRACLENRTGHQSAGGRSGGRGLFVRVVYRIAAFFWLVVDLQQVGRQTLFFAQPAAEVDLPAAVAAERQGRRLAELELFAASRTTHRMPFR